jgi:hypothetical protein
MNASPRLSSVIAITSALGLIFASQARADEAIPRFTSSNSSATLSGGQALTLGQAGPNRFANVRFELHLDFSWYSAFGAGGRIEVPLARNGIIEGVDDEIALSVGAEVYYFYSSSFPGVGVTPILAVQWNFFVSPAISLFPELGVAFLFGPGRDRYWGTFIAPYVGLGVRFHFTDRNAVLVRASWPAGLQLGITF